jgi:hypothetical protein
VSTRINLGAPGIYDLLPETVRSLTGERMDVAAFVGVAPRGPAREPVFRASWADPLPPAAPVTVHSRAVPVESWEEYTRLFGRFEGPGLLPYAVAAFFEQRGRRAYVVRIIHAYGTIADAAGVASGVVAGAVPRGGGELRLRARNEGSWGNGLRARLELTTLPLGIERATTTELVFAEHDAPPAGTLCRLWPSGSPPLLRFIDEVVLTWDPDSGFTESHAILDAPLPGVGPAAVLERVEIVEARLTIDDGAGREEVHEHLGLGSAHPRWMAAVLVRESGLVFPDEAWIEDELVLPDASLAAPPVPAADPPQFAGGLDRYADIVPEDFIDLTWTLGDETPGRGVQALAEIAEVALVVAPDLYSPQALVTQDAKGEPDSLAGPTFERCVPYVPQRLAPRPDADLEGLRLDPEDPADLDRIVGLQQQLERFADDLERFVVLLDVPPRLHPRRVLAWRAQFRSSFVAAYHPWLYVARRDDQRDAPILVPPSAVAAGIIAQREIEVGIHHGPANVIAAGVVKPGEPVSAAQHDVLHPLGINVFQLERDGLRLTAARTLSRDPAYRQLSVRRLMSMLRRVLERQMQWMVFEPHTPSLRADVRYMLRSFLRQLHRANAFRGAREEDAFFVRCDDALNPTPSVDAGRLVAEIGVAPAEPLEFLVLRIARDGEGLLQVEG